MTNVLASSDYFPLLFIPFFLIAIGSLIWHFSRSQTLLERWAARNGFKLVSHEYRWLARGPFWWRTSKGQSVYRVEVIDSAGETRTGYVRVGGWLLGLFADVASVEWDKPRSTHGPPGFPIVMSNDKTVDRDAHE